MVADRSRLPPSPFGVIGEHLCSTCSVACCHKIAPPFLTETDVRVISAATGRDPTQFSNYVDHTTGEKVLQARADETGTCIFLTNNRRCSIYMTRPLDCRLFPLDLEYDDGQFFWGIYEWSDCPLSKQEELEVAIDRAENEILPLFTWDELRLYATDDNAAPSRMAAWRRIQPVKLR